MKEKNEYRICTSFNWTSNCVKTKIYLKQGSVLNLLFMKTVELEKRLSKGAFCLSSLKNILYFFILRNSLYILTIKAITNKHSHILLKISCS